MLQCEYLLPTYSMYSMQSCYNNIIDSKGYGSIFSHEVKHGFILGKKIKTYDGIFYHLLHK